MPTPNFVFRLAPEKAAALKELAKVYGSANTSDFLREMVGAVVSGDMKQLTAFNTRLFQKMGEQLVLDFAAKQAAQAQKPAQAARKRRKRGGRPKAA